jgi:hypothetical protein
MKKFIGVLLILGFCSVVLAKEIKIGDITAKRYNDVLKQFFSTELSVRYDVETKDVLIYIDDIICTPVIVLSAEKRLNFIQGLNKYFEWNDKAVKKGIKIEKEIAHFETSFYFKYGDEWDKSMDDVPIILTFFSRSAENHELVIEIGKITSSSNEFITCSPSQQYFEAKQVKALKKCLLETTIDKKIAENEKEKSIEDEFK